MTKVEVVTSTTASADVIVAVPQPMTPSTAEPLDIGLVEISSVDQYIPGPPGPQGPVGPQGPQGADGYVGADGPPNVLSIGTVTTVPPPNGAATATITGTSPAQVLNLGIPAGNTGAQGIQGIQGVAGPPNVLVAGTTTTGAPGSAASISITGTSPSQTLNMTIPRGDVGATGTTGAQGAPGQGVPTGGSTGQVLSKINATDYNTQWVTPASGTVTAVTGTAPVVSSGGNTPAISMAAATASVDGYLKATDWVIFNAKGSGTVTSVTGTAPVVSSGGNTPAISMAAATGSVNGYLTSTDWTAFNGKAPLASPVFTGNPTAPTPTAGDNDTSVATTAFVATAISNRSLARNRICNPAFQIAQEQTTTTVNGGYFTDQWLLAYVTSGGTVTASQNAGSYPGVGSKIGRVLVGTADTSIAATEYLVIMQYIEGNRLSDFMWGTAYARPAVLRFTALAVNAASTGTYCASLRDGGLSVSYVSPFTLSTTSWTDVTIPIPACTIGTWPTDNTKGAVLTIAFAAGSNFNATSANTWLGASYFGHSSMSNGWATAGNDFRIANVGLYLDPTGSGVAPAWEMPDEAAELIACQRYYEKSYNMSISPGAVNNAGMFYQTSHATSQIWQVQFMINKRAAPTISAWSPATGASGQYRDFTAGADRAITLTANVAETGFTATIASAVVGNANGFHWVSQARM